MVNSISFPSEALGKLKDRYREAGQGHLLDNFNDLTAEQADALFKQLSSLDVEAANKYFDQTVRNPKQADAGVIEPLPTGSFASTINSPKEKLVEWRSKGLSHISQGKVAVILMAGGQGTRLGSPDPKGCYDIGMPSHKSLFQIQAERILRLQEWAAAGSGNKESSTIPWVIMTSEPTYEATRREFEKNDYYGLKKDNVLLFNQGTLPCFDFEGKIFLESPFRVAVAPDGNGGIYGALIKNNVISWLRERGVECVHSYCVDNCLVRVADPVFIGYALSQNAECGTKVVPKASWDEPVGVICKRNGRYSVVEYSEISESMARQTRDGTPNGELSYNAGNIVNHFYTLDFLQFRVPEIESTLEHHVAKKKIKHYNSETGSLEVPGKPNGIKLERFVFDVFPYVDRMAVLEVERADDFSPLKNAPGSATDCPETSRKHLIQQCVRFARNAGATFNATDKEIEEKGFEISPLVSYSGEGLEGLAGKQITVPLHIDSPAKINDL
ncbi:UDP-N-acetylglucosamine pyrophosphorylase [Mycoemilia scoparia]|uniref:UDP-N-acetylglucosamine diphosphorylase n=1 Tax=Mycoemilia scoparia TaxID=417184 RepID=A0A9W8DTE2_9FUNG|nr:UDP-N-acetylglucosamine pyrophosphorylase [Mycoemilia scoparia]